MRFVPVVLYGSLVLEALLKEKLITKDHYDHMWNMFNSKSNSVNYILIDLSELVYDLDGDDKQPIIDYMIKTENLTDFYNTKLAI
jgi:hypothetical protein